MDQAVHQLLYPRGRQAARQERQVQDSLEPGLGRTDRQAARRDGRDQEQARRYRHRHHGVPREQAAAQQPAVLHAVHQQRPEADGQGH